MESLARAGEAKAAPSQGLHSEPSVVSRPADVPGAAAVHYLDVLWGWRATILLATVLAAAVALAVSLFIPPSYRATATVLVGWSKLSSEAAQSSGMTSEWVKTYEALVTSPSALAETMSQFNLGEAPYDMKSRDLEKSIRVEALRDTSLVQTSAEMPEPELAAEVANFLARRIVLLNEQLNDAEMGSSRAFLQAEATDADSALAAARDALREFQQGAQLEVLAKRLEIHLELLSRVELERQGVDLDLTNERARIARLENDIVRQTKTIELKRELIEDPAYEGAIGGLVGKASPELLSLSIQREVINPTHSFLERELSGARGAAAALGARGNRIDRLTEENRAVLERVQDELIVGRARQEQLRHAYELARDAQAALLTRLDTASLEVASKSTVLKLVGPALPPDRHSWPKRALLTLIGGLTGLLAVIVFAILTDWTRRIRAASMAR